MTWAFANLVMLNIGLALSQYIVLRAGVFSVATAGLAAVGAYTAGILVLRYQWPPVVAGVAALLVGAAAALVLSLPLARLRGVFQAIATLAFVQIVQSIALYATPLTGGATGLNGIPKSLNTLTLFIVLAAMLYLLAGLGRSSFGRACDTTRQDETAAVSLGIPVSKLHRQAFALSGAIAGVTGAMMAMHNYSVVPEEFGFGMLVSALAAVVLGGRSALLGPIVGAIILTALPEIARPLSEGRMVVTGILLIVTMIFLPQGIVDSLITRLRRRRARGRPAPLVAGSPS
jgi:branched-chain amino acid transport system permease protein